MDSDRVEQELKMVDALETRRAPWDSKFQELAEYIQPRKSYITRQSHSPDGSAEARLFDTTAVRANLTLASGFMQWMVPKGSTWFRFEPPPQIAELDAVSSWYNECSSRALIELENSNFYTEIHEFFLDRSCFGTSLLFVDEGEERVFNFQCWPVGHFSISEDHNGFVDVVTRKSKKTAKQLEQMFGKDALPEKIQEALSDISKREQTFEIVHVIRPRDQSEIDEKAIGGASLPVADLYISREGKTLLRESGYEEMPAFASRYLKWGDGPYGWSPGWVVLPDAKQLNVLQRLMDQLCEVQVQPRVLIPSSHEGIIDFRAHGKTEYDDPNMIPREWLTQGRYDIGIQRISEKQENIREAMHNDLFRMFAAIDKQMTAREVSARESEKLTLISPTFTRLTREVFDPMLRRVFTILVRRSIPDWESGRDGILPVPPREILEIAGGLGVFEPKVAYASRIGLSQDALENEGILRTMDTAAQIEGLVPGTLDNFDVDEMIRVVARNNGAPEGSIREEDERDEIRQQKAAAAQESQIAELASGAADGSIPLPQ